LYVLINKKLNKKLIICKDGTMKSINKYNYLEWTYYGDCIINRFLIYYQFDCRYENLFIVKNKYIIGKKYYTNIGTFYCLKQKYEKINWETGEKTKICKNCNAVLLSKNEKYLVFEKNKTKKNSKHFIIIEIETNKKVKEFYAKEVYWVD